MGILLMFFFSREEEEEEDLIYMDADEEIEVPADINGTCPFASKLIQTIFQL